ncbi:MAG: nuclear transport factor 2 family protein [Gemmatimonadota bacterium]|nr:MAG: nuclear transport factor 2 family protein [Gemmatimonadota bacterium]
MNSPRNFLQIVPVLLTVTFIGCQSRPDVEALRSEILNLHKTLIDAHWNKDIDFFTENISEDYFSVGNGEIRKPTKEEITTQVTNYLDNTTFTEYRDLREPIIGFSNDGSVAWSLVQVKVAGKRTTEEGTERDLDFTCAWITLYERQDNTWLRLGEVSTFK